MAPSRFANRTLVTLVSLAAAALMPQHGRCQTQDAPAPAALEVREVQDSGSGGDEIEVVFRPGLVQAISVQFDFEFGGSRITEVIPHPSLGLAGKRVATSHVDAGRERIL